MSINDYFKELLASVSTIYEQREAERIAQYIFEDVFQLTFPFSEKAFSETEQQSFEVIKTRLLRHEPWQHIVGQADFYGYKFNVNPDVLIPRPETEELVYQILQDLKNMPLQNPTILDIGTGSGCIPITLKKENPTLKVFALDVSKTALATAQTNAKLHDVDINFVKFDILNKNSWQQLGQFDIIISNPPYITNEEKKLMSKNVLEFEPQLALFVKNETPLIFYEHIAEFAQSHLNQNGTLYFEINEFFGQRTLDILKQQNFKAIQLVQDMSGRDRMVIGKK